MVQYECYRIAENFFRKKSNARHRLLSFKIPSLLRFGPARFGIELGRIVLSNTPNPDLDTIPALPFRHVLQSRKVCFTQPSSVQVETLRCHECPALRCSPIERLTAQTRVAEAVQDVCWDSKAALIVEFGPVMPIIKSSERPHRYEDVGPHPPRRFVDSLFPTEARSKSTSTP
jgi:hypothetical protein